MLACCITISVDEEEAEEFTVEQLTVEKIETEIQHVCTTTEQDSNDDAINEEVG